MGGNLMRINNSRGLTLIETVIALTLVVVVVTAFAGAMTTGLKSENQMEDRKEAVDFASEIIESLKVRTDNNKNMLSEIINENDGYLKTGGQIDISDLDGNFSNQLSFYTAEIKYNEETSGLSDLLELTVEIKWTTNGENYNEKITTLLAVDLDD